MGIRRRCSQKLRIKTTAHDLNALPVDMFGPTHQLTASITADGDNKAGMTDLFAQTQASGIVEFVRPMYRKTVPDTGNSRGILGNGCGIGAKMCMNMLNAIHPAPVSQNAGFEQIQKMFSHAVGGTMSLLQGHPQGRKKGRQPKHDRSQDNPSKPPFRLRLDVPRLGMLRLVLSIAQGIRFTIDGITCDPNTLVFKFPYFASNEGMADRWILVDEVGDVQRKSSSGVVVRATAKW